MHTQVSSTGRLFQISTWMTRKLDCELNLYLFIHCFHYTFFPEKSFLLSDPLSFVHFYECQSQLLRAFILLINKRFFKSSMIYSLYLVFLTTLSCTHSTWTQTCWLLLRWQILFSLQFTICHSFSSTYGVEDFVYE